MPDNPICLCRFVRNSGLRVPSHLQEYVLGVRHLHGASDVSTKLHTSLQYAFCCRTVVLGGGAAFYERGTPATSDLRIAPLTEKDSSPQHVWAYISF